MPGKFPVGKPQYPSWILPIVAVSLSLTVHALWLLPPQPEIGPRPAPEKSSLFAYPNLDARTWSPTLFSLPSALGFSGAIQQNTSNVQPPLKSPVQLTRFEQVHLAELFPDPVLSPPLALRSNLPVTVFTESGSEDKTVPSPVWRLQVLEGPPSRLELSRLPLPPSGGSVLVTGVMRFDRGGQLSSLLLDPVALPEELRGQILRSLRRVRRMEPDAPARIRFRFAYAPAEAGE